MHNGKIPFTFISLPSNDSSPINIVSSSFCGFIVSMLSNIPTAIGKSKYGPSFLFPQVLNLQ